MKLFNTKLDILCGMASEFNYDDIMWFSVNKIWHMHNTEVNAELKKLPDKIQRNISWVMCPKTLNKMKTQLKNRKLNFKKIIDYNKYKSYSEQ